MNNAMSYATIKVKPVTPRLGAEVSNIDLTATLTNRQVDDLHTALAEHQVLFFRNQKINLEQQKTLGHPRPALWRSAHPPEYAWPGGASGDPADSC
jgi:alpha-ketoglutarate-dependent taurine dioxygenase